MSESMVCPHARQQAVAIHRGVKSPEVLLTAAAGGNGGERLKRIKPEYYGLLGSVVQQIVNKTVQAPVSRRRSLIRSNGWNRLKNDAISHVREAVSDVYTTPANQPALNDLNRAFHTMQSTRRVGHKTLFESLMGGGDTAVVVAVGNLAIFHTVTNNLHSGIEILRNSFGPVIEQAGYNSRQSDAINDMRIVGKLPGAVLAYGGKSVCFEKPLLDLPLDDYAVYSYQERHGGTPRARTVADLRAPGEVVGCPVLFTPKQTEILWNWTIDQALERGLVA